MIPAVPGVILSAIRRSLRSVPAAEPRNLTPEWPDAECDNLDSLTTATLGAVMAGNDTKYILGALEKFLATMRTWHDADLVDHTIEIL